MPRQSWHSYHALGCAYYRGTAAVQDARKVCIFSPEPPIFLKVDFFCRYFTPAQIAADTIRSCCWQPVPPTLSSNTHLTSLAQAGPLKLQCDRGFISLLDTSTHYIIAEATRTISLRQSSRYKTAEDALFLGVQALHKSYGVCPNAIATFTNLEPAVDSHQVIANDTRYIIRDFQELQMFKERPYVKGFPHMRSYAEVPLKGPNGYVVGSYCVVDNKVRSDFFDDETVFVLTEIANSIMEYLELVAMRHNRARGERLMEGLSLFTEGPSSLMTDSSNRKENRAQFYASHRLALASQASSCTSPALSRRTSLPTRSAEAGESSTDTDSEQPTAATTPTEQGSHIPSWTSFHGVNGTLQRHNHETEGSIKSESSKTFARAANTIREAMNVEGLVFLDGPREGVKTGSLTDYARRTSSGMRSSSPTEADHSISFDDTICEAEEIPRDRKSSPMCNILGSSLSSHNSAFGPHGAPLLLHEASLSYLITTYPQGHVFSADEYGVLIPHVDQHQRCVDENGTSRRKSFNDHLPEELQKVIAKAGSLIFLPLWDYAKEQFFAGIIGWTTDPTCFFEKEDLTCLMAFGNAVMTKLARSEADYIARAKSDFIASISHELRSPLHGILASAEILKDTAADHAAAADSQRDMVHMIESCGSTLLDTLNHLLDYSAINKFGTSKSHVRNASFPELKSQQDPHRLVSKQHLCKLVQDVVEVVHFGQSSNKATLFVSPDTPDLERQYISIADTPSTSLEIPKTVGVLVNIENRTDWYMPIQVGAWKRIVMNLFANALKYTNVGLIEVALRMEPRVHENGLSRKHAHLMVRDTGIGMSDQYLRHQLYKPFKQENPLSVGTGLGLSIVKKIIGDLGGTIDVESKVGVGTRFDVFVPLLESASGSVVPKLSSAQYLDPDGLLQRRTVCFASSLGCPNLDKVSTDEPDAESRTLSALRGYITSVGKEWFGMDVISATNLHDTVADFYIIDASSFDDAITLGPNNPGPSSLKRVISVGRSGLAGERMFNGAANVTALPYPVTPRTLSKALLAALQMSPELHHEKMAQNTLSACLPQATITAQPSPKVQPPQVQSRRQQQRQQEEPHTLERQHHLLLVDDNVINLKLLTRFCKSLGYTFATASDGLEAVSLYKSSPQPFSLVLMDISMPIMDGFEATRAIREYERKLGEEVGESQKTCIVALTGLGSEASIQEAFVSGIDAFHIKPVKLKDIKGILDGL